MLSERQLQQALLVFEERMQGVTDRYFRLMGQHIRELGKLTPSDINRLVQYKRLNANMERIKGEIAKAINANIVDIEKAFSAAAEIDMRFAAEIFGADHTPTVKSNKPLERILKAQLRITNQEMANLSRTTLLMDAYRNAVDTAVQAVQSGVMDYNTAVRQALKRAAADGLRVQYPNSGLTRRLDSAVRMNVLDGVRAINRDVMEQIGKDIGADGIELSAHALCAEDHLPYQGTQVSNKEFSRLQNRLDRPFGKWNCKHRWWPIFLGRTKPAYSEEQLREFAENSNEPITIDGRTKTRYQWTQEQRRIETAIRYQKDASNLYKETGDTIGRRSAQATINALKERYSHISEKAGLREQPERAAVSGYHWVKTREQLVDAKWFEGATFASDESLNAHVKKHLGEYGDISVDEYVSNARALLQSSPSDDIMELRRSDGSVSKYRISTNDFVVSDNKWNIRTAFKPKDGIDYWRDELERNK